MNDLYLTNSKCKPAWHGITFCLAVLNLGFACVSGFASARRLPVRSGASSPRSPSCTPSPTSSTATLILSKSVREEVDTLMNPVLYTTASIVGFVLLLVFRKFFTQPQVAWAILNIVPFRCSAGP